MTADEFLKDYGNDYIAGDYVPWEVIDMLKKYAKMKCKEQREICSRNAKLKVVEVVVHEGRFFNDTEQYDMVDEDSIINSEEPEI